MRYWLSKLWSWPKKFLNWEGKKSENIGRFSMISLYLIFWYLYLNDANLLSFKLFYNKFGYNIKVLKVKQIFKIFY